MARAESSQRSRERASWLATGRQEWAGVPTLAPISTYLRGVSGRKRARESVAGLQQTAKEKSQPSRGCGEQTSRAATAALGHAPIRASQPQLARVGPFLTRIEARAVLSRVVNLLQDERQRNGLDQPIGQHDGMAPDGFGRLKQRAVRLVPATGEQQPMLDEQANQLGKQLAQNAHGLVGAPFIDFALLFEQFNQQLHLPAQAQEHQRFGQGEQGRRHIGERYRPSA